MLKEDFIAQYVLAVTRQGAVYSDRNTGNRFITLQDCAAAKVEDARITWEAIQLVLAAAPEEKAKEEPEDWGTQIPYTPPSRR